MKVYYSLYSSQTTHSTRVGTRKRKRQGGEQVPESEEETKEEVVGRGGEEEEGEDRKVLQWPVNVLTARGLEGSLVAVKERDDDSQQLACKMFGLV